jgi:Tol biopolymer transport system component
VQIAGDRAIFNVKRDAGVTLWSKPVDGGEEAMLVGMPTLGYNDAWAVTDSGVYFTRDSGGGTMLRYYDYASRAVRDVAPLPRSPAPGGGLGLSVSRDGQWVLYSQAGEAQSDIMFVTGERAE